MTACLLYDKIHKNQAENLLHLMLYFSFCEIIVKFFLLFARISVILAMLLRHGAGSMPIWEYRFPAFCADGK